MLKNKNILISVLMPVYNNKKYLRQAIDSILNQTFTDFEFLIINDGSTDSSKDVIKSYKDSGIRYKENAVNLGIIKTLNKGMELVKGKYIVRMDSDDISLPKRLEEQFEYMEKHPKVAVAGCRTITMGKIEGFSPKPLLKSNEIKANTIFSTPFAHPSVIIRKKILDKNKLLYDKNYHHAEDYELWTRIMDVADFGNVNKKLLKYRLHDESICNKNSDIQKNTAEKIRLKQIKKLGINPTKNELTIHQSLKKPKEIEKEIFFKDLENWLNKLLNANNQKKIYNKKAFEYIIKRRWLNVCYMNTDLGIWILKRFFKFYTTKNFIKREYLKIFKLFIKTLF